MSSSPPPPPPPEVEEVGAQNENEDDAGCNGSSISNSMMKKEKMVVGYALSAKKVESFITPSLLNQAEQRGIQLLPIHLTSNNLLNPGQGPFHCILHKLSSPDWDRQLLQYSSLNPHVPIIDHPHAIRRLHDRLSMLRLVSDLPILSSSSSTSLAIPNQICVQNAAAVVDLNLDDDGFQFPVIAKSLVSDGTAKSHQMYLVFNRDGLRKLKMEPPLVLQQFVNHGGVVFKVYVVGDHVSCVRRKSLPDYYGNPGGGHTLSLLPFSLISNLADADADAEAEEEEGPPMPPWSFLTELARELRNASELNLFNFDVIREKGSNHRYYIIDINYFPGYAKMPSYETVFTDFLLRIHHQPPPTNSSTSF